MKTLFLILGLTLSVSAFAKGIYDKDTEEHNMPGQQLKRVQAGKAGLGVQNLSGNDSAAGISGTAERKVKLKNGWTYENGFYHPPQN